MIKFLTFTREHAVVERYVACFVSRVSTTCIKCSNLSLKQTIFFINTKVYNNTATEWYSCCNDKLYNRRTQLCCGRKVFDNSKYQLGCCPERKGYDIGVIYNNTNQRCCNSVLINRKEGKDCCGKQIYNTKTSICCPAKSWNLR